MSAKRFRRSSDRRTVDGGVVARRAVTRWAWRLFRREWRQQILVMVLLTVAVAATVAGMSASYNLTPVPGNAEFGSANHLLRFDVTDGSVLDANVSAAASWFGVVDVVTHRNVSVSGTVDSVEYRGQDPFGPYSGPMLALRQGRYPASGVEIAVTNRVADEFLLDIGSTFALDGVERSVVGIVENPSDLSDEFALIPLEARGAPESATLLIEATTADVDSFLAASEFQSGETEIGARASGERVLAIAVVLGVAVVAMVLVALVTSAGFVVLAQRRQRQFGMLAAIGATERQLRLVVIANGVVVGGMGALAGTLAGALCWAVAVPFLESAIGFRVDAFNVPWWLIGTAMLLALVTATGAAWWPARSVARMPVVSALSGRPPRPEPVRRSGALAGLLLLTGVISLVWADTGKVTDPTAEPIGDPFHALLIGVGIVATVVGMLYLGPVAIRALAAIARWLPVAMRLALRDLARYRARSGAALAAISLALGIASAVVIAAAASEPSSDEGNLSDRQLLIWTRGPDQPEDVSPFYTEDPNDEGFSPYVPGLLPDDLEALELHVEQIAAHFDDSLVTPLDVAMDPAVEPDQYGQLAITLAEDRDLGLLDVALVYIASPELLRHYGRDLSSVASETQILTVEAGELWFPGLYDPSTGRYISEPVTSVEYLRPSYSSLPGSFITPAALQARGWEAVRVGWLVEAGAQLDSEQLAAARADAARAGMLIESRRDQSESVAVRWPVTVGGLLVALSVIAMTVGLIRGEAAGDLRILTATGATASIRRTLTASTAGALALLGALIGGVGAYVALGALYIDDLSELSQAPVIQLLVIVVGVPLSATAAGWLLAGREPSALARPVIE